MDWAEGNLSTASKVHDNLINVEPGFSNAMVGDYTLTAGSVAIDAGDPTTENERGFDGHIPVRADIGAFETELLIEPPAHFFQESNGQVAMEAEHYSWHLRRSSRTWETYIELTGYVGPGYIGALPDTDLQFTNAYTITSPELRYTIHFTTTGTYYVWVRGYAPNGAGDSLYISLDDQIPVVLTGFAPQMWSWSNRNNLGSPIAIEITEQGFHTLHLWQREDGLRLDQIVLTTDGGYNPGGSGP